MCSSVTGTPVSLFCTSSRRRKMTILWLRFIRKSFYMSKIFTVTAKTGTALRSKCLFSSLTHIQPAQALKITYISFKRNSLEEIFTPSVKISEAQSLIGKFIILAIGNLRSKCFWFSTQNSKPSLTISKLPRVKQF